MKKSPAEKLASAKSKKRVDRKAKATGTLVCTCRRIRQRLNLTIADVSDATGISKQCVCVVERGAETTITTARKLATFYGKTLDELWPSSGSQAENQQ